MLYETLNQDLNPWLIESWLTLIHRMDMYVLDSGNWPGCGVTAYQPK